MKCHGESISTCNPFEEKKAMMFQHDVHPKVQMHGIRPSFFDPFGWLKQSIPLGVLACFLHRYAGLMVSRILVGSSAPICGRVPFSFPLYNWYVFPKWAETT